MCVFVYYTGLTAARLAGKTEYFIIYTLHAVALYVVFIFYNILTTDEFNGVKSTYIRIIIEPVNIVMSVTELRVSYK